MTNPMTARALDSIVQEKGETMTTYKFQCQRCFIMSGIMSKNIDDAPACCGGELMAAIPLPMTAPLVDSIVQEFQNVYSITK